MHFPRLHFHIITGGGSMVMMSHKHTLGPGRKKASKGRRRGKKGRAIWKHIHRVS